MALKDFSTDIYRCFKCGGCLLEHGSFMPGCPSGERFGFLAYYARGRMDIAYALVQNKLTFSPNTLHILYSCADCKVCENACREQTSVRTLEVILEMKREAVENGLLPPEIRDFLKNIDRYGNPYLQSAEERGKWAEGTAGEYTGQDFLLFVGCVGSYDDRGKKISKAFAQILQKAGVSFGILGTRENCCGNEVNRVGDKWLFESLARKNIELFKEVAAKRILVFSPHAYYVFKNEYPAFGGEFEVLHSSTFMLDLIKEGRIMPKKELNARVTYHDPCWLGRRSGLYDPPRKILESIPGLKLVEMPRNREKSFCCGGGGGNFISDILGGGGKAPSRIRVREAAETGAEILAVSCPICARMLEDALKSENLDEELVVRDISEIVRESMV
jgi:Fe-S oxidoreductase